MKNQFNSANEYYSHFVSSDVFHEFNSGLMLTEGVFEIAGEEECFWFLKIISDSQWHFSGLSFQNWNLKRIKENEFKIEATDVYCHPILEQRLNSCNFFFQELTVCVIDGKIMLPSEFLAIKTFCLESQLNTKRYYPNFYLVPSETAKKIG